MWEHTVHAALFLGFFFKLAAVQCPSSARQTYALLLSGPSPTGLAGSVRCTLGENSHQILLLLLKAVWVGALLSLLG